MVNILIMNNHVLIGEGTKAMLEGEEFYNVNFVEPSLEIELLLREEKYDIYILDLYMHQINSLELIKKIQSIQPEAKILICTVYEISNVFNFLIEIGISGFISKSFSKQQLLRNIECALNNEAVIPISLLHQLRKTKKMVLDNGLEISFSQEEEDILMKVVKGNTNEQIAAELFMSKRNVERYLTGIYKKLNVKSRSQAISKAQERYLELQVFT